jgi:hypothetical protein
MTMPVPISDPRHLFDAFRSSATYRAAWKQYFDGRRLADDVTLDEQRAAFEQSDAAKLALIAFVERDQPIHHDPASFGVAHTAIQRYVEHVRFVQDRMLERPERDEIVTLDNTRSRYHIEAAQAMIDNGYAPTLKLGRTLARLVLVDLGIETFEDARRMV